MPFARACLVGKLKWVARLPGLGRPPARSVIEDKLGAIEVRQILPPPRPLGCRVDGAARMQGTGTDNVLILVAEFDRVPIAMDKLRHRTVEPVVAVPAARRPHHEGRS